MKLPSLLPSALLLACALPLTALSQEPLPNQTSADSFLSQHGDGWRTVYEPVSGNTAFVYGSSFSVGFKPATDFEFEAAARLVVDDNPELFGFSSEGLVLDQVKYLNLSRVGSSDKVAVLFRQEVAGVPVMNGSVSILFDRASGNVLALDTTGVPVSDALNVYPVSSPEQALAAAGPAYEAEIGFAFDRVDDMDVVVVGPSAFFGTKSPLTNLGPTLAYVFDLSNPGVFTPEGIPAVGRVIVSAAGDLSVLKAYSTAHALDGNVKGNVNLGEEPNTPSNQEQPNLPNMYVRQNGSSGSILDTTDVAGNYDVGSATYTLFFELRGPWVNVNNYIGSDSSFTLTNVSGPGNDVLFNPTKTEYPTAEVAGFYWVNYFHDWIVGVDPGDTTMNASLLTYVNRNDMTCNAYYTNSTINLMVSSGSCANTAYSDVILHEEGHWANERYNGSVTGAFHEGNADAFCYYMTDDWCLRHFIGTSCLRSALQTSVKKCNTDGDETCNGGSSHTEGQALASALWAVRANLNTSLGNGPGDAVANALFSGWMNVYNDGGILNVIQDHWLVLDDDNGNLGDLTPNFVDITGGFAAYNWPAFPDLLITPVAVPATNATVGNMVAMPITVTVQSLLGGTITGVNVHYATVGGFASLPMTATGNPNEYSGTIPGAPSPNSIHWYVSAASSLGSSAYYPGSGADNPELYHSGVLVIYNSYDFEAAGDEGWTHVSLSGGTSGDQWERANPAGSNAGSDPGAAHSGTKIWGTDLSTTGNDGLYEPSASGELRSPTFNLSAAGTVRLQYRRWLAVEEGLYDDAILFVNTTNVFHNQYSGHHLDTEWMLHDLDISAQAAGNPSVQIKYRLTADGGLEFGGWNIDDFMLYRVDAAPTGFFANYGNGYAGTGGVIPTITGTGTPGPGQSISVDIGGGLPNALCLFFLGTSQTSIVLPSGAELLVGNLIGGAGYLLALDGAGTLSLPATLGPAASGDVFMQALLQDVGAGNGKYSATNGLQLSIP
ncbi:MAG: hypothetical protein V2A76_07520 [Planctomycetota bacterium]